MARSFRLRLVPPCTSPLTPSLSVPSHAAWETCKENAQPVKRGRNANALSERLEKGVRPDEEDAAKRAEWEALIERESSGGDPLDAWCGYIRWQQDTCVTGGGPRAEQMLPLLERCAFALKDDERYKDDHRYLRVWVQYADLVHRDAVAFYAVKEADPAGINRTGII